MSEPRRPSVAWAWLIWLGLFLAVEIPAAIWKTGGTFSECIWFWFSVRERRRFWLARRLILALFLIELSAHFLTGGAYPVTGGLAVILTGLPAGVVIVLSSIFEQKECSLMSNVMLWLNGKKTVIGAIITIVAAVPALLGATLPAFGVDTVHVALYVGYSVTLVGLLHKLYKRVYGEEHQ